VTNASFSEVLTREAAALASVADVTDLDRWRIELVDLATNQRTAYAKVLRPAGDPQERGAFLDSWQDLIATAVARVVATDARDHVRLDPRQMAVSVLAALYGGAILSRVSRDSRPLRTSIELALAPLLLPADTLSVEAEKTGPPVP
jgi:hypothetical protein